MIVDSHCHLNSIKNKKDVHSLIKDAQKNDVQIILNISTKEDEFDEILSTSKKYKNVFNSIGIHPHESSLIREDTYKKMSDLINDNPKTVAIGETGLDFYYNHSDKKSQITAFNKHIELSIDKDLPVIIHTRNAEEETKNIIKSYIKQKAFKGVIHCFTGSKNFAKEMNDLGLYMSISGVVTFKNANEICEAIKVINTNKLLIETDSPFLAPEPLRGTVNEPANVVYVLKKLSKILNIKEDTLGEITTKNFLSLFNRVNFQL